MLRKPYWMIMVLLLGLIMPICSCKYDQISYMNKQIKKISKGRFEISSSIIEDNYYVNGNCYFKVPVLPNGWYLYYKQNSAYPYLNHLYNKEGLVKNQDRTLPIQDVREIFVHDNTLYVLGNQNYAIFNNNSSYKIIKIKQFTETKKEMSGHLFIKPVKWEEDFTHNISKRYSGIKDNKITAGDPTNETRVISGLTKIALVHFYDNGQDVDLLIGTSLYGFFSLDLQNGTHKWLSYEKYYNLLNLIHKSNGNITFNDIGYDYLTYNVNAKLRKVDIYSEYWQEQKCQGKRGQ